MQQNSNDKIEKSPKNDNLTAVTVAASVSTIIVVMVVAFILLVVYRRPCSRASRKFSPKAVVQSKKYQWEFRRDHLQLAKELGKLVFLASLYRRTIDIPLQVKGSLEAFMKREHLVFVIRAYRVLWLLKWLQVYHMKRCYFM